jgi:hypothetical protein
MVSEHLVQTSGLYGLKNQSELVKFIVADLSVTDLGKNRRI